MAILPGGGTKAPTGSGFSGNVPEGAVWDESLSQTDRDAAIDALIADAIGLGNAHVLDALLLFFRKSSDSRTAVGEGYPVASEMRQRVTDVINGTKVLNPHTRDAILGILDTRPKHESRLPKNPNAEKPLSSLLTEPEQAVLLDAIVELTGNRRENIALDTHLGKDGKISFSYPDPASHKRQIKGRCSFEKTRDHKLRVTYLQNTVTKSLTGEV